MNTAALEKDLFGEPIVGTKLPVANGVPKRKPTMPKGYAATPGTGPTGETCRSCAFKTYRGGVAGRYLKCQLMHAQWTGGPGTDIKAKSPACAFWAKESTPCPECEGRGYRWDLPAIDKHGTKPGCKACRTTGVKLP